MTVRAFRPGDEVAQVRIYNEAAAALPKFKPARLDEVRRRARAPEGGPPTRFLAEEGGEAVGYAGFSANGRVSHPWCLPGHEGHAEPLFQAALAAMRQQGLPKAFAAYRGDWDGPLAFFRRQGFAPAREMVNFVVDLPEMPTPAARPASLFSPLTPADVPAVLELGREVLGVATAAALEAHLFRNPYFRPAALFALRDRAGGTPVAVGVLVVEDGYADPKQLDAAMPCYRLGAFGTEGQGCKRVNGLWSFLTGPGRDGTALALDLLGHAAMRLSDTDLGTLAAQVPSDAAPLLRFYQQYFRRQGSFPVYERSL